MEDIINSFFEFSMFVASIMNIIKILEEKVIKGFHWATVGIASLWGFWNLHYYSSLDQWWSFYAGILLVISNSIWLRLVFYYAKRNAQS